MTGNPFSLVIAAGAFVLLTYFVTKEVTKDSSLRRELLLSVRYTVERVGATIIALWIARRILGL